MAPIESNVSRLTFGSHARVVCEQSDLVGRSLVRKRQESEPVTISVNFSFLLCMSKVKYHWPKRAKGEKTVNPLCLTRFPRQGCALRVPGCLRRLTFAFGRPDNLNFFHISFMLGTLDLIVWNLWAPCNFP